MVRGVAIRPEFPIDSMHGSNNWVEFDHVVINSFHFWEILGSLGLLYLALNTRMDSCQVSLLLEIPLN